MRLEAVVAVAENGVIGRAGELPWSIPEDLRHFRRLTLGHAVLMGSETHRGVLRALGTPLPGRHSIVISRRHHFEGVSVARTLEEAVSMASEYAGGGSNAAFVIGGASVYMQLLPLLCAAHVTHVHRRYPGDVALPPSWLDEFVLVAEESGSSASPPLTFALYEKAQT